MRTESFRVHLKWPLEVLQYISLCYRTFCLWVFFLRLGVRWFMLQSKFLLHDWAATACTYSHKYRGRKLFHLPFSFSTVVIIFISVYGLFDNVMQPHVNENVILCIFYIFCLTLKSEKCVSRNPAKPGSPVSNLTVSLLDKRPTSYLETFILFCLIHNEVPCQSPRPHHTSTLSKRKHFSPAALKCNHESLWFVHI